jgi:flagellar FliJ protein
MKKFRWRLQRLLDVRQKQEDTLRAELTALTEQTAALRGRILMEKAMLRSRLAELRHVDGDARMRRQQAFMQDVAAVDKQIAVLNDELSAVEQKRQAKVDAMMTVRKFRKALERLRAQAQQTYDRQMHQEQQKDQDESTNAAFTRVLLGNLK